MKHEIKFFNGVNIILKKNEIMKPILSCAENDATGVIMLNKRIQAKKDECHMVPFIQLT